jgi:hypothetical protein
MTTRSPGEGTPRWGEGEEGGEEGGDEEEGGE